jgi:Uma2 family endonuclease
MISSMSMVVTASHLRTVPPPLEQRMLFNVSWRDYVTLRDLFDGTGMRMTYLRGQLEIMSPSGDHERWKKNVARFVELFAHLKQVELYGYGSTTFKKEVEQRGCEPDECYLVGHDLIDYPHIVLEVIHTSPLLDKLEVYSSMGVAEVWIFEKGVLEVHELDRASMTYRRIERSHLIPGLDLASVARHAQRHDTPQALREFEAEVLAG